MLDQTVHRLGEFAEIFRLNVPATFVHNFIPKVVRCLEFRSRQLPVRFIND